MSDAPGEVDPKTFRAWLAGCLEWLVGLGNVTTCDYLYFVLNPAVWNWRMNRLGLKGNCS